METKEGTIISKQQETLQDNFTGNEHKFVNPANISFNDGSIVIFVELVVGNDKIIRILKEVKK